MVNLKTLWATTFGVPETEITEDLIYQALPQWDSVGHMNLVSALEQTFGIMLEMDEIISMNSYAKCKEILTKHGAQFV